MISKWFIYICLFSLLGCSSYQKYKYVTEELEMPSRVFNADFNEAWQSVLDVMKKYDLPIKNQEAGILKTSWMDNTEEINFADSFSKSSAVKAAKFKLIVNVIKGFKDKREVSKVTIYKRQLIQNDILQGWKEIPSDNIIEKTILYRIERLITIDLKLKEVEKKKEAEELKNF
ncbi:MAG: hypothetical protein U0T83_11050 [Bacteriovoracaceae bacterium]